MRNGDWAAYQRFRWWEGLSRLTRAHARLQECLTARLGEQS
jgi:hypothetical protein